MAEAIKEPELTEKQKVFALSHFLGIIIGAILPCADSTDETIKELRWFFGLNKRNVKFVFQADIKAECLEFDEMSELEILQEDISECLEMIKHIDNPIINYIKHYYKSHQEYLDMCLE